MEEVVLDHCYHYVQIGGRLELAKRHPGLVAKAKALAHLALLTNRAHHYKGAGALVAALQDISHQHPFAIALAHEALKADGPHDEPLWHDIAKIILKPADPDVDTWLREATVRGFAIVPEEIHHPLAGQMLDILLGLA